MRQLTASQKIAILENRVAQLEKQAMLEGLKAKIAEALKPFKRLVPETKKVIKDTRKNPKQIAKDYMKVRNNSDFKKAMKQIQKEAGSSPVKQATYVIDVYKSGELDSSRRASMPPKSLMLFILVAGFFGPAVFIACALIHICYLWLTGKLKGVFKRGSMDKEAVLGIVPFLIILWLLNDL